MDKPMTLDKVRDGLQKLFDAGPGVACNAFPLAEWIEAIDAILAREPVRVTVYESDIHTCMNCESYTEAKAFLESFAASLPVTVKVPDALPHASVTEWTINSECEQSYVDGWNACREAMLRGEK
jgi:hypothetical protein